MFTACDCWKVKACAEAYICPERLSKTDVKLFIDVCWSNAASVLKSSLPWELSSTWKTCSIFCAELFLVASLIEEFDTKEEAIDKLITLGFEYVEES